MKKFWPRMMLASPPCRWWRKPTRVGGGGNSFGRQSQSCRQPPARPAPRRRRSSAAPASGRRADGAARPACSPSGHAHGKACWAARCWAWAWARCSRTSASAARMASALSAILMIAAAGLAVMFIVRMFRRKDTPPGNAGGYPATGSRPATPAMPANATPEIGSRLRPAAGNQQRLQSRRSLNKQRRAPHVGRAGRLRRAAFLRHAKSLLHPHAGGLGQGRPRRPPRIHHAGSVRRDENADPGTRRQPDFTDVVQIDAELLGIETSGNEYLASVKFNGMIRKARRCAGRAVRRGLEPVQAGRAGGWVLAGIQQLTERRSKLPCSGFYAGNW
jgi:hypothetical protein